MTTGADDLTSRSSALAAPTLSRDGVAQSVCGSIGGQPDVRAGWMPRAVAPDGWRRPTRAGTVRFATGEEIFSPGLGDDLIHIVRSGCVRLYKSLPDGRLINLGLLGPNTVFAQEDAYEGLASGASAEALTESIVTIVTAGDLAALLAESPELATAMVRGMTRRLTELQTLVEQILARDASVRLATTLIALADAFGQRAADGLIQIAIPLTHQSLANMIGANRVTVTRKLLELQDRGLVQPTGRSAFAVDPAGLRRHARAGRITAGAGEARPAPG